MFFFEESLLKNSIKKRSQIWIVYIPTQDVLLQICTVLDVPVQVLTVTKIEYSTRRFTYIFFSRANLI